MKQIALLFAAMFVAKISLAQFGYQDLFPFASSFIDTSLVLGFSDIQIESDIIYIQTSNGSILKYDSNQNWSIMQPCYTTFGLIYNPFAVKNGFIYTFFGQTLYKWNENGCVDEIFIDVSTNHQSNTQIKIIDNKIYLATKSKLIIIEDDDVVETINVSSFTNQANTSIFSVLPESDGTLWIGTSNGLVKRSNSNVISIFTSDNSNLKNRAVTDIKKVSQNQYIVSTLYDIEVGIYLFDGINFESVQSRFQWMPFEYDMDISDVVFYDQKIYIPSRLTYELTPTATNPYTYNIFSSSRFFKQQEALGNVLSFIPKGPKFVINSVGNIFAINRGSKRLVKLQLDEIKRVKDVFDHISGKELDVNQIGVKQFCTSHIGFVEGIDIISQTSVSVSVPIQNKISTLKNSSFSILGKKNNDWRASFLPMYKSVTDESIPSNLNLIPGPVIQLGAYDIETIEYYNRVWKVNRCDIENFKFHYENGNVQNGSYQIPKDVLEWPANPFPVGYNRPLAPYYDYNADGFYNPYDGDYPQIKGEQMLWWIGNDQIVNDWNLESLGLEVRFSLYAYTNVNSGSSLLPLNFSYFWEIEFTNVSDEKIDSLHLVSQIDGDIGFAQDDYVRYNVDLNSATFYNGFDLDGAGAPDQYGYHWPLMSVGMVEGVYSEYENQVVKNHNFIAYNNGVCPINCEPQSFGDFMNFINGKWRNGTEVGYGGNGVAAPSGTATNIPTKYMFPGFSDPNHTATNGVDPGWAWREEESVLGGEQNPVGDRRGFMSTGPFKLEAGASKKITYMYHHTFDSTGMTTEEKIQKNRLEQMQLIEWFENNSFPSDCLGDGVLSVNEVKTKAPEIAIYPNPANTWLNVQVDGMKGHIAIEILDINGRVVLQHASTHSLTTLDLTPLKSGIYILRVNDGESLLTRKVIKN